ncbi:MAG: MBL fold metallo-hydrolase [Polyangiaceae bacterium]|nr:MBL fold metallo-hydrolase [Polyangiaceae bacterium]
MQITIVASGSGGNATLFSSGGACILIDAGVGPRVVRACVESLDGAPPAAAARSLRASTRRRAPEPPGPWSPGAVVITHAHSDHAGNAPRYSGRPRIPVHATEAPARAVPLGDRDRVHVFGPREPFAIGPFTISPCPLPHDAAQVALVISDGARSAAIVTDLGEVPPGLVEHVAGCDVLLVESNHDERMLEEGPYPAHLKRRIRSARGHLSNVQTHALLSSLRRAGAAFPHTVVLMHLSEVNNCPEIALEVAADALASAPRPVRLLAAPPRGPLRIDAAAPRPEPRAPRPSAGATLGAPGRAPRGAPSAPNAGSGLQLPLFPSI